MGKGFQEYVELRPELREATDWRMYSGHDAIAEDVDKLKEQYPEGFDYMLDQNTQAQTELLDRLQFDNEDVVGSTPEPLKELDSYLLDRAPYSVGVALGDENSYTIGNDPAVGVVTPNTLFGTPKMGRLAGEFRSDRGRVDTAMHETGHYHGLMADNPTEVWGEFADMAFDKDNTYEAATTGLDLYRSLSRKDDLSMEQAIRYLAAQGVNLYDPKEVEGLKNNIIRGVERIYNKSNGAIEFNDEKKAALTEDLNLQFEKIPDALYYVQYESDARSARIDNLTKHHLQNLANGTSLDRGNGDVSTIFTSQFEQDGNTYIIPTIWDGKELDFEEAKKRAFDEGVFEVFDSREAADAFDYMIHNENPVFQQEFGGRMEIIDPDRAQQYLDKYDIRRKPMGFAKGGTPMPCGDPMSLMFPETFEVSVGTDPISGNDVPPGSSPENVRDDIPAVISSGEYVVPADVVRYHGLKTFMQLRDEAKMGLMAMHMEGQIQTIDEEDLEEEEMPEDEESEGEAHETAEGNEVEAAEHEIEVETMDVEDDEEEDEDVYASDPGQFAYKPSVRFAVMKK